MDPAIIWNEAENFPYADRNPYVGPAVAEGIFTGIRTYRARSYSSSTSSWCPVSTPCSSWPAKNWPARWSWCSGCKARRFGTAWECQGGDARRPPGRARRAAVPAPPAGCVLHPALSRRTGQPAALHFLYEADRKTENTTRFKLKLRAHYHFIVKRKLQRITAPYNVHTIRAVLTESIENNWAQTLRETAAHPIVSPRPSPLFWFTSSELFTRPVENGKRPQPLYLEQPEWIFKPIWASPVDDAVLTLGPTELAD